MFIALTAVVTLLFLLSAFGVVKPYFEADWYHWTLGATIGHEKNVYGTSGGALDIHLGPFVFGVVWGAWRPWA
jgi:hypothetical protein